MEMIIGCSQKLHSFLILKSEQLIIIDLSK